MTTHYVRAAGTYRVTMPRDTSRDTGISYRALGVLARLLGNAEGYDMPAAELARGAGREGRDAIRVALAELERAGYLARVRERQQGGRWAGQTVLVYDTPGHSPPGYADFPAPAFPRPAQPALKSSTDTAHIADHSSSSRGTATAPADVRQELQPAAQGADDTQAADVAALGLHCPSRADVAAAGALVAAYGAPAVAAAALAAMRGGDTPYPSIVRRALTADAQQVATATQQAAAADRAAEAARRDAMVQARHDAATAAAAEAAGGRTAHSAAEAIAETRRRLRAD